MREAPVATLHRSARTLREVLVRCPGLAPTLWPTRPPARAWYLLRPCAAPRPTGRTRSSESPLRSVDAGSFHSSPAVRSATQVLLWVSSSPPLPRHPPPLPTCICWTRASCGHGQRVPTGAGRGRLPLPHVGLGRAPLPRKAEPRDRPLSGSRPWRGAEPLPTPPTNQETGKAGCLVHNAF